MHADWQQIAALIIVAVAAWFVGKRLWSQIAAFQGRPARRPGAASRPPPPRPEPLMQIQLKPPVHLKRPAPPPDERK